MINDRFTTTHTVFKNTDINKYLNEQDIYALSIISSKISNGRLEDGKKTNNKYLVINTDEPYAEKILEMIHIGELDKRV